MSEKDEKIEKTEMVAEIQQEEKATYFYIGPNLPGGALKKNTIFVGTKTEIKEKFKEEIEKYPQLERLIVKVETLAEAKAKASQPGNLLYKCYQDVLSTAVAEERR